MIEEATLEPVVKRRERNFRLGIIGHGFVGKAVDYCFSTQGVTKFIIDPKENDNTLQDLCDWEPQCVFICLPTPAKDDGGVDTKDIDDAVMRLVNLTEAFIVIKSTVPPDAIDRLSRIDGRIVYEPEFLQESNSKQDMIEARFRVFGVHQQEAAQHLEGLYNHFSLANPTQIVTMSPVEASFFKYTVNNYLSMKVTFMNQLKKVMDDFGGSYNQLSRALMAEPRMGHSHMKIPGPDGKDGFGGACFPKDLSAFINFVDTKTDQSSEIWKTVQLLNNEIRSEYDLNDREREQNVNFDNGQTETEQQDKDNGSPD
jgi:UDPglucose 6-dehydrogenase|tara:strand:- start:987 stop:1925 length:939 start_codon:yes stop_codon:yes gene_type:complete